MDVLSEYLVRARSLLELGSKVSCALNQIVDSRSKTICR